MEKKTFYLCDGEVEECRRKSGCYKNGGACIHTSDIEHAKNFEKPSAQSGFYENVTIPGSKVGDFLEQFSKKSEGKVIRNKIILEGVKEYVETIQKVKQEAKDACEINQKLNEVLESRIGIIQKLRGQGGNDSEEAEKDHEQWLLNKYYSQKIIELLKKPMNIEGVCTNKSEQLISSARLIGILKHTISVIESKPINFWGDEEF